MKKPSVVVLTGAGISAESGIATFRASDGLWEQHKVDDVATPEGYRRNPKLVQAFYNARREQLLKSNVQANCAHVALAKLENVLQEKFLLVTQNIDNLHECAGSERLIHMHGELLKVRCPHSNRVYRWEKDVSDEDRCSCCQPARRLRPHVVWFGEMPLQMERIYHALGCADYFISIGTSGSVYPAAGFVEFANQVRAHTVELNLEPSHAQSEFKQKIYGPATQIVPEFVENFLQKLNT